MNSPGDLREVLPDQATGCSLPPWNEPSLAGAFDFHLPVLSRSVALLRVLSHGGIVDLDLASSVIALDPGLAYRVLQLANRDLPDHRDRIWQLPLAIVAAGRAKLDEVLDDACQIPLVESDTSVMQTLVQQAVLRAALAHTLAQELASCSVRKCFLSGLLFELPALVTASEPSRIDSRAMLLSDMCHSLPVGIVRAALAEIASKSGPTDTMSAIVLIAQQLLLARRFAEQPLEELAGHPYWRPWSGISTLQRRRILKRCSEVGAWVNKNLYRVHPWELMAQLDAATREPLCKP